MKQHKLSTFNLAFVAMLIALNVVIARIFLIPIPWTRGNINLCDTGIFITALILGRQQGAIVGALSGFLLDVLSGFGQYLVFSLIIHGLEGWITGWLGYKRNFKYKIGAILAGGIVMVVGYLLTDILLYGFFAGWLGSISNLIQLIIDGIIALLLVPWVNKYLLRSRS